MSNEVFLVSTATKEFIMKPSCQKSISECERNFEIINKEISADPNCVVCKGIDGHDRKVYLLGNKDLCILNLLTWNECIDELSNKGE